MEAVIYIEGPIGPEYYPSTTLDSVRNQFESYSNPTSITLYIDSPGGSYTEGKRIRKYILSTGLPVTAIGLDEIYSIATLFMLTAPIERRFVYPDSKGLIHNPSPYEPTFGDADEHERRARDLRIIEDDLAKIYSENTNLSFDEAKALMSKNELITAEEMIRIGLAGGIKDSLEVVARRTKAVAMFNINEFIDMSNQTEELKGIAKAIDEVKSFLFKNQEKTEPQKTEDKKEPDPKPETKTAEDIEALKKQIEEIEAKLAAERAEKEKLAGEKAEIETTLTEAGTVLNEFKTQFVNLQAKVKELESMPVPEKEFDAVNSGKERSISYPAETLEKLNKMATGFKNIR